MKKMPCLFVREFHGKQSFTLTHAVTPGCEWVMAGEGVASRKRDGTACLVANGTLYKRYDAKKDRRTGKYKLPPEGAIPCDEPDPETGHWPHWVAVDTDNPADKWHVAAWLRLAEPLPEGTYELCGPHFSANPEGFAEDTFIRHGAEVVGLRNRLTFNDVRSVVSMLNAEGIVFAHPDGRFAKIRRKDFGLGWPISTASDALDGLVRPTR